MATRLRNLRITKVDRVLAGANQHAHIVLFKAADPSHDHAGSQKPTAKSTDGGNMPTEQEQLEQLRKSIDEAVAAAVDPVKAELATVQETYAAEKTEFDAAVEAAKDPTEIDKSALPEPVRKRLEEAETLAKQADERVSKMLDEAEAARWLAVAKGLDFVAVAKATDGDAAVETGVLLHSIAKAAGVDAADQLLGVLEAANSKLAQSDLLKAAGKDGAPAPGGAEEQLEKAAEDIRKAAPTLTTAQAYAQAVAGNPALAVKAQEEMARA